MTYLRLPHDLLVIFSQLSERPTTTKIVEQQVIDYGSRRAVSRSVASSEPNTAEPAYSYIVFGCTLASAYK